ncbi:unannotated protein [freshwater metagenome]|uniref:Unannotated protein n=1 Tax=freshwater metagenome TaxID=449393 RepID=A0A6J7IUX2_9ZZZZ
MPTWHDGHVGLNRAHLGADLVGHCEHCAHRGPNESDASSRTGFSQVDILREEAVARVQCLRTGLQRGFDYAINAQITFCGRCRADANSNIGFAHEGSIGICIAIDRDGRDAHRTQCTNDAGGNLATISNENGVKHQVTSGIFRS